MRFQIVCAGTAGHINPALSIAGELRRLMPDCKIEFIGSGRELERKLIPQAGYELKNLRMTGIKRGITPGKLFYNVKTVKNVITAGAEAGRLIREFKPDAVIGTGGYVCYPVIKSASKMGIPTAIHESNAVPGLAAKVLSTTADKVLVSFKGVEGEYRKPERVEFTGTPVRTGFREESKESARRRLKIGEGPLVVSFWGSLGAEHMNEAIAEFIIENTKEGFLRHIHATGGGARGLEAMRERLKKRGYKETGRTEIRAYIEDMAAVMAASDIVICRAGASTLAELTIMGKPAVLVPSPYVPNNHQEYNARKLEEAGGAVVLTERECTGRKLYETVKELIREPEKLREMGARQKGEAAPKAAEKIAEIVINMCK